MSEGEQRPVRRRVGWTRASRRYLMVLGLVATAFLFMSLAPDARWTRGVLLLIESATLAVALWTSGVAPRRAQQLVLLFGVLLAVVQLATEGTTVTTATIALSGIFVVVTIVVIARGLVSAREINRQSVLGAVSVYMLVGILFAFVYSIVAVEGSGPLFAQDTDGTASIRLYFSFVTLTTIGYGDYTPGSDVGRTLANLESLFGQLYLVTVVAVIVSQMPRRRQ